jgi:hypothetical protein
MKKENTVNEPTKAMPYDALLPAVFNSGQEKKDAFIKEFRQLFAKYKAELSIEDFGRGYMSDEKMVVDFEWDEDICNKTDSGIIEQWVIGRWENGR